jgi:hypothetical protein
VTLTKSVLLLLPLSTSTLLVIKLKQTFFSKTRYDGVVITEGILFFKVAVLSWKPVDSLFSFRVDEEEKR